MSLYLALSTSILNIKKFLDKMLKDESVLKIKCKRVEERDRPNTVRQEESVRDSRESKDMHTVRESRDSQKERDNLRDLKDREAKLDNKYDLNTKYDNSK